MKRLVLLFCAVGCGNGGADLNPLTVSTLPPGDAVGSSASGVYDTTLVVTGCEGACVANFGGLAWPICAAGKQTAETFTTVQTNGTVRLEAQNNALVVTTFRGGITKSGTFDVGGFGGTAQSTQVSARAQGSFAGSRVVATARARTVSPGIDCIETYSVTGNRR